MNATLRLSLTALLLLAMACSSSTPAPADRDSEKVLEPTEADELQRLNEAAEEAFAGRLERQNVEQAIEAWKKVAALDSVKNDPEALAETYENLAKAHYFLARYHEALTDEPDKERILSASKQGVEYAGLAVEIRAPDFHRSIKRGAPFEAELEEAPPEAAHALLAYARNLDLWSKTEGVSATVAGEPIVDSIMEFVAEHQPEAHFGAAHRYFGTRWIERAFHRSPEKSAEAFETALELEPHFLITRVLRARHLATATGDRDLFESDLQAVIAADEDLLPAARAENAFARQLAAALLADVEQYF